jgi:WD40 repeat protein
VHRLHGHAEGIQDVAVTPDGERTISASWDRTLRVWDLESGVEAQVLLGHIDHVDTVFALDGGRAVSVADDETSKVWDLSTGEALYTFDRFPQNRAPGRVEPGGRAVAALYGDALKVWVWPAEDEDDEMPDLRTLRGHTAAVNAFAWTPDGRIISASDDGTLGVWNTEDWSEHLVLRGHTGPVTHVAVLADGTRAVSASADGTVRLWDIDSGAEGEVIASHEGPVVALAAMPDGQRVISAGANGTLTVCPAEPAGESLRLTGHAGRVWPWCRPAMAAA